MEPIGLEIKNGGETTILHRCIICGHERRNRTSSNDDPEVVIRLSGRN